MPNNTHLVGINDNKEIVRVKVDPDTYSVKEITGVGELFDSEKQIIQDTSKPFITGLEGILVRSNGRTQIISADVSSFTPITPLDYVDVLAKYQKAETFPPVALDIDLTSTCTNNCIFCYTKDYRERRSAKKESIALPLDKVTKLLIQFRGIGTKLVRFVSGGDPLLHPDICRILELSKTLGYTVSLVSNGDLSLKHAEAIGKYVDHFRVSVNAGTEQQRRLIHLPKSNRFTLENVFAGLKEVYEHRKRFLRENEMTIGVHYLVQPFNIHGIQRCYGTIAQYIDYLALRSVVDSGEGGCGGIPVFCDTEKQEIVKQIKFVLEESRVQLFCGNSVLNAIDIPKTRRSSKPRFKYSTSGMPNCFIAYTAPILETNGSFQGPNCCRGNENQELMITSLADPDEMVSRWRDYTAKQVRYNSDPRCTDKLCPSSVMNRVLADLYSVLELSKDQTVECYNLFQVPMRRTNISESQLQQILDS